ncbi:MAG: DUF4097 family beta strand repeat protein [Lachnospiraceae bacterium]|nr:DUF4097 family beta strand repeat protein [Lachnospiraceae bacterium]
MGFRKFVLITGLSMILGGGMISAGAFAFLGFDISRMKMNEYERQTVNIEEDFTDIKIDADLADIRLELSDDGKCRVDFLIPEEKDHSAEVKEGCLSVFSRNDGKKDSANLFFQIPCVTLYLPEKEYTSLNISLTTGDVELPEKLCLRSADISVTAGSVTVASRLSDTLSVHTVTGSIGVEAVVLSGEMRLSCNTGEIELNDCDASSLYLSTNVGDIEGSLLSEKIFRVQNHFGDVDVPQCNSGGICDISCHTGDIEISLH